MTQRESERTPEGEELLTIAEAAAELGLTKPAVGNLIAAGRLRQYWRKPAGQRRRATLYVARGQVEALRAERRRAAEHRAQRRGATGL